MALRLFASAIAAASCGRSLRLPLSNLDELGDLLAVVAHELAPYGLRRQVPCAWSLCNRKLRDDFCQAHQAARQL